jgi:arsenate reductase
VITLYGIASCDSVRRARRWLEARGIAYRFHDLRADGLDPGLVRAWAGELGWRALLNRQSSTWRQLPAAARDGLDEDRAVSLMETHPLLIKRPLLDRDGRRYVGYSEALYASLFAP